jgi:hypothetical protein
MARTPWALGLVLLGAACSGAAAEESPSTPAGPVGPATTALATTVAPTPIVTEAPSDATSAAETVGAELAGRWAHYDVVAYEDGVLKTLIISYGFTDFSTADGEVIDTTSFCFSEQRTDAPIETSLSDAATQAIVPPSTPVAIDVVDGRLTIRRDATPTPLGARLDDPTNEPLPTDPSDPRVVDADGDGKPGVTVSVRVTDDLTGELYIIRREVFAYDAELVEPDLVSGTVTDRSEQVVLGVSDPVFATSGTEWVQYPDLAKSPILLRRVGQDWDCERLRAERDELFPPTPDVDW